MICILKSSEMASFVCFSIKEWLISLSNWSLLMSNEIDSHWLDKLLLLVVAGLIIQRIVLIEDSNWSLSVSSEIGSHWVA